MLPNKRPLIIGVTGNIGSGKSTFCNALEDNGLRVYYADLLAQQRLEDPLVIKQLLQRFGEEILAMSQTARLPEPRIDRRKLAALVFEDSDKLQFLNSLIHPLVLQDMDEIVRDSHEDCVVFEVPLLFEAGLQACFDFICLVHATIELRRTRILARGGRPDHERSKFQISDEEKLNLVDMVVNNDGSTWELKQKAVAFAAEINHIAFRKIRPFYAS